MLMSLFLLTFLARQNAASWSRVVGVGKILLESFTSEDTQETDLSRGRTRARFYLRQVQRANLLQNRHQNERKL